MSTLIRLPCIVALILALVACEATNFLTPSERAEYEAAITRVAGLETNLEGFRASLDRLNDSLSEVRANLELGELEPDAALEQTDAIVAAILEAQEKVRDVEAELQAEVDAIAALERTAAERNAQGIEPWLEVLPVPAQGPARVAVNWLATALGAALLFKRSRQNLVGSIREKGLAGIPAGVASAFGWSHSSEDPAKLAEVAANKAADAGARLVTTATGEAAVVPIGVPFDDETATATSPRAGTGFWTFLNAAGGVIATAPAGESIEVPPGTARVVFGVA